MCVDSLWGTLIEDLGGQVNAHLQWHKKFGVSIT